MMQPGSSVVLTAEMTLLVPPGTVIVLPGGRSLTLDATPNILTPLVGSTVTVPANATGIPTAMIYTNVSVDSLPTAIAKVSLIAGSASRSKPSLDVDGVGTAATLFGFGHLALDPSGDLYLQEGGSFRKVTASGIVTHPWEFTRGYINMIEGIAVDSKGTIYGVGAAAQQGNQGNPVLINYVSSAGILSSITNFLYVTGARNMTLPSDPRGGLAVDSKGNLYYSDRSTNQIFMIASPTQSSRPVFSVFSGTGALGIVDGKFGSINAPKDMAFDGNDNLYVKCGNAIRKIAPDLTVTTFAAQIPDMGDAIAVDRSGNVFVASQVGILRIDPTGKRTSYPMASVTGNNHTFDPGSIYTMVADNRGSVYVGVFLGVEVQGGQIYKVTY
ncbi:hypothetical protein ACO0LO_10565 [Undibacterium sp. TJN25]|uniref:hypothetical protein n=1 Tax=Undibacterium sp. TJN25 TaxID=3413056 RepID=UPI003BEFC85C